MSVCLHPSIMHTYINKIHTQTHANTRTYSLTHIYIYIKYAIFRHGKRNEGLAVLIYTFPILHNVNM